MMIANCITIRPLENRCDSRGSSFTIPEAGFRFIGRIKHAHIATVLPQGVRGNHFHIGRKELLVVLYTDSWTFAWSPAEEDDVRTRSFEGEGTVLIEIAKAVPHAVRNDGAAAPLTIMTFWDFDYDESDTVRKVLI